MLYESRRGRLAQLVERFLYTEDVGGSSPSSPTSLRGLGHVASGQESEDRMRRFCSELLGMLFGYPLFAFAGYWAIGFFSGNHFDGSVEASMTAAFVFGPIGAVVG